MYFCFSKMMPKDNAKIICGQSTSTCPQKNLPDITRHQIKRIAAYGNAQYLRQCQKITGRILNGIMSQFQSVQGKWDMQTK